MRRLPVLVRLVAPLLGVVLVAGCSPGQQEQAAPDTAPSSEAPSSSSAAPSSAAPSSAAPSPSAPSSSAPAPSASPSAPASSAPAKPPNPISVQALIQKKYDGRNLRVGESLGARGDYRSRNIVTYEGDGITVSGVMFRPNGRGPFPVVVLNHGYIDPDVYDPGQGMRREQDYLAEQGYLVLHVDYRGHASGENKGNPDYELRLPYSVDTVNAVLAIKSSGLDYIDAERVAWMGRSMGGNVTLNALVAQPGLVDAAVLYASTSSLASENWETFSRDNGARGGTNQRIDRTYGLPDESPKFWLAASPRDYFDRITEPVLVHHGEQDDTCPIEWSEEIVSTLKKEGKQVEFVRYDDEGHTFYNQWQRSIERSKEFLDRELA